jgi:hypothetical protein
MSGTYQHRPEITVVITTFEAFRSKILKKTKFIQNQNALRILPVCMELKSKAYRRNYSQKCGMLPPRLYFDLFGGNCSGGRTHTQTIKSSSGWLFRDVSYDIWQRQEKGLKLCLVYSIVRKHRDSYVPGSSPATRGP